MTKTNIKRHNHARLLTRLMAVIFALTLWGVPASAQDSEPRFGLFADNITYDAPSKTLTAKGNVILQFETQTLYTDHIIFDEASQQITLPSAFEVISDGRDVIQGNGATYNRENLSALITDASVLLSNGFQLITHQMVESGGRYRILDKTVASSCYICDEDDSPFWSVRASQVILDSERERLLFKNPFIYILGVPMIYLPRLSTPGPGVSRATGFLVPRPIQSDILGGGIELPYYIVTGAHSDLTLTSQITKGSKGSNFVLDGDFRKVFAKGTFRWRSAVALEDSISHKTLRAQGQGEGAFDLQNDYRIRFNLHLTNDADFKQDFGYGADDRLYNFLILDRARNRAYTAYRVSSTQSLRRIATDQQIPLVLPEAYYHKVVRRPVLTGRVDYKLHTTSLLRGNDQVVTNSGVEASWHRNWTSAIGLRTAVDGRIDANYYAYSDSYSDERDFNEPYSVVPLAAVSLRYPLTRKRERAVHLAEPIVQLVIAPNRPENTPIEDATQAELEDDSLFLLDRFDGFNQTERGSRINFGLRYTRYRAGGPQWDATIGRIYRFENLGQYPSTLFTAQNGRLSDYIAGVSFSHNQRFYITNQLLFNKDLRISKNETRLQLKWEKLSLSSTYVRLTRDAIPDSNRDQHEVTADVRYQIAQYWNVFAGARRDIETRSLVSADAGFEFQNECARFAFNFTLEKTGRFGLQRGHGFELSLVGFGASGLDKVFTKKCAAVARGGSDGF